MTFRRILELTARHAIEQLITRGDLFASSVRADCERRREAIFERAVELDCLLKLNIAGKVPIDRDAIAGSSGRFNFPESVLFVS